MVGVIAAISLASGAIVRAGRVEMNLPAPIADFTTSGYDLQRPASVKLKAVEGISALKDGVRKLPDC